MNIADVSFFICNRVWQIFKLHRNSEETKNYRAFSGYRIGVSLIANKTSSQTAGFYQRRGWRRRNEAKTRQTWVCISRKRQPEISGQTGRCSNPQLPQQPLSRISNGNIIISTFGNGSCTGCGWVRHYWVMVWAAKSIQSAGCARMIFRTMTRVRRLSSRMSGETRRIKAMATFFSAMW